MKKYRVGILGATGMVGQRFVTLMQAHPWFELTVLAASASSAGKTYAEAVRGRWAFPWPIPQRAAERIVYDAADVNAVASQCDFVFCAVSLDKAATRELEESYARAETPVVSNNSACRGLADVPMLIPEINPGHAAVIAAQRKCLGVKRGFIAVKPNCSIQSYVPALSPLRAFGIKAVSVCTYQAISGAGKTLERCPEILDNAIPFISGEEEKSEQEPLKIWGELSPDASVIVPATAPMISAQCIRVPVSDGHLAAVSVAFERKPSREEILRCWESWHTPAQQLALPSAPTPFVRYLDAPDRPQPRLDRDREGGMSVSVGRLREDPLFDYKFVCLSHNTLRGAAGGAVLMGELLCAQGYIQRKE